MTVGLRLDLRQTQQLVMTPQLQQAIKLLQLSNLELAAFVENAAEENPLIEIDRDREAEPEEPPVRASADPVAVDRRVAAGGDHALAGETFDTGTENLHEGGDAEFPVMVGDRGPGSRGGMTAEDLPGLEDRLAERTGLREHLRVQLGCARAPVTVRRIALCLVEELDEHGYLRADLGDVAARLGIAPADADSALALLHDCEPTGVGARSLGECLGLQLRERGRLGPAMQTLLDNLELVARGDWRRLRAVCGVEADDLAGMVSELRGLDPRPCAGFTAVEPQTLVPDLLLRRTSWGGWEIELNPETLPRVLVDHDYALRLGAGGDAGTRRWIADRQANASWLIRSLDQRARTVLKVAAEIVRQQQRFLDEGIAGLRPLTLRAVADAVGVHESTASRVTANKYIATGRGTFELRFFFGNALGDGDDEVAAEAVRHRIRSMVAAEDPAAILSDETIVERLAGEGVEIARRTVAKYRSQLNIPSSVERRRQKRAGAPA